MEPREIVRELNHISAAVQEGASDVAALALQASTLVATLTELVTRGKDVREHLVEAGAAIRVLAERLDLGYVPEYSLSPHKQNLLRGPFLLDPDTDYHHSDLRNHFLDGRGNLRKINTNHLASHRAVGFDSVATTMRIDSDDQGAATSWYEASYWFPWYMSEVRCASMRILFVAVDTDDSPWHWGGRCHRDSICKSGDSPHAGTGKIGGLVGFNHENWTDNSWPGGGGHHPHNFSGRMVWLNDSDKGPRFASYLYLGVPMEKQLSIDGTNGGNPNHVWNEGHTLTYEIPDFTPRSNRLYERVIEIDSAPMTNKGIWRDIVYDRGDVDPTSDFGDGIVSLLESNPIIGSAGLELAGIEWTGRDEFGGFGSGMITRGYGSTMFGGPDWRWGPDTPDGSATLIWGGLRLDELESVRTDLPMESVPF